MANNHTSAIEASAIGIAPGLRDAYRKELAESLAKIDELCANKNVMATISGRLTNHGASDDAATYQKNISETLRAWESLPDDTWRV